MNGWEKFRSFGQLPGTMVGIVQQVLQAKG